MQLPLSRSDINVCHIPCVFRCKQNRVKNGKRKVTYWTTTGSCCRAESAPRVFAAGELLVIAVLPLTPQASKTRNELVPYAQTRHLNPGVAVYGLKSATFSLSNAGHAEDVVHNLVMCECM